MNSLRPSLILSGTIIGAGMFGLPYAFSRVGFLAGVFYLLLLAFILFVLHLAYADIARATEGNHRMVGYASAWIGKGGALFATVVEVSALFGGLLVYLVLGAHFLASLFGSGNEYLFISAGVFSIALIFGAKLFEWLEWALAVIMALLMGVMGIYGLHNFDLGRAPLFSIHETFALYGIAMFSLYGASAIPELARYLSDKQRAKKIIALGTFFPALLYILFIAGIWGLSTSGVVSEDALSGLARHPFLQTLGFSLGFLALVTSYWTISLNLKHVIQYDFRIPHILSTLLLLAAPIGVALFVRSSFIELVGLVGSVAIGLEALLIIWVHAVIQKSASHFFVRIPAVVSGIFVIIFIAGIAQHIL